MIATILRFIEIPPLSVVTWLIILLFSLIILYDFPISSTRWREPFSALFVRNLSNRPSSKGYSGSASCPGGRI